MEDVVEVATPLRQKVRMGTRIGWCLEMWWYLILLVGKVCLLVTIFGVCKRLFWAMIHWWFLVLDIPQGYSGSACWWDRYWWNPANHSIGCEVLPWNIPGGADFSSINFLCPIDGFCFTCNASESMNSLWLGPGHLLISVLVFATL